MSAVEPQRESAKEMPPSPQATFDLGRRAITAGQSAHRELQPLIGDRLPCS